MLDRIKETAASLIEWARGVWEDFKLHLLAFAVFLLGLLEVLDPWALAQIMPERYNGVVLIGISVAVFLLKRIIESQKAPEPLEDPTEPPTEPMSELPTDYRER